MSQTNKLIDINMISTCTISSKIDVICKRKMERMKKVMKKITAIINWKERKSERNKFDFFKTKLPDLLTDCL